MSSTSTDSTNSGTQLPLRDTAESVKASSAIAWSSFFLALLQSACTFFAALDGLRVAIGVSSLLLASTVGGFLGHLHVDWVRLPMIALALAGSLLNLVVLWQVRRLRSRPAAHWRQRPLSSKKIWMERVQLVLSILTLALIGVEEYWHIRWHHHV